MKIESILAALLEIQKKAICHDSYYASTKLNEVKASVDTLVAMLKKELDNE